MKEKEKIVLVAGTFDILHESHINMLRNARNLGDRLVVMLSTDEFNETKGCCKCIVPNFKRCNQG